jgi:hypothetical protein
MSQMVIFFVILFSKIGDITLQRSSCFSSLDQTHKYCKAMLVQKIQKKKTASIRFELHENKFNCEPCLGIIQKDIPLIQQVLSIFIGRSLYTNIRLRYT